MLSIFSCTFCTWNSCADISWKGHMKWNVLKFSWMPIKRKINLNPKNWSLLVMIWVNMLLFFFQFRPIYFRLNILVGGTSSCDSGWSQRSGKCYRMFGKTNWISALRTCQSYGANLVSIEDSSEQYYVEGQLKVTVQ